MGLWPKTRGRSHFHIQQFGQTQLTKLELHVIYDVCATILLSPWHQRRIERLPWNRVLNTQQEWRQHHFVFKSFAKNWILNNRHMSHIRKTHANLHTQVHLTIPDTTWCPIHQTLIINVGYRWVNDFNFCINSQICQHFLGSLRPAIEPKFRCVIFPLLGCAFVFCAGRPGGMRDTLKTSDGRPTLSKVFGEPKKGILERAY